MRHTVIAAFAIVLLGALTMLTHDEEPSTEPVVLNKNPPPPSGTAYRQAYAAAWTAPMTAVPDSWPIQSSRESQVAPPQIGTPQSVQDTSDDRDLLLTIAEDTARMKAMGIGVQEAPDIAPH